MIKSKGILTVSMISIFAVESAYAAIASSGYVDQQVETRISEVAAAETGEGNVVSSISADGNTVTATKGITAEETKNKVNTIRTDGTATDTAYPSEKAVATALNAKQDKLEGEVLTNTATGDLSLSIADATPTNSPGSVVIGNASSAADSADLSSVFGSMASSSGIGGVAIGAQSEAAEYASTAVGLLASSKGVYSTTVGTGASSTGMASVALGGNAKSQADYAIQLGMGTNSEANTLSVGLSDSNNYKLLGSDGKIPAERLPFTGDVLTNTATANEALSVAGATPANSTGSVVIGNGSSAADSAEYSSVFGSMASSSGPGGVAVGVGSQATGNYATAVGNGASAAAESSIAVGTEASASTESSIAVGTGAEATGVAGTAVGLDSQAVGDSSTAIGPGASSSGIGSVAIGAAASTTGNLSVALGGRAQGDFAIQLGAGINSEANTLSVALGDANNYKLLGSDGKIPAERLPFTGDVLTNTATGSNSVSTGGAVSVSAEKAVGLGYLADGSGTGAIAIGRETLASGVNSVGIGSWAEASGPAAISIGDSSAATKNSSIAVGNGASASGESSIAIGDAAVTSGDGSIQLGYGTNSEANTFSVGLGNSNNYKLLGSDGKIPAERLPVATSSTLGGVKSGGDISISSTGAVSVVSALKAVQDANGANIAATYATKNSVEDLQANKVKVDWTTSNVNKVLVIGSDSNYPDVLGKVTVARITENFLSDTIQTKLSNAVTSVATSGSGAVVTGFSKSGNSMTVTKSNVKIPVGSATATTYATIWVE